MAPRKPGVASPAEFGHVSTLDLSRSRQRNSISLEEIAEKTKISLRFLRAIEDEEFDKLPGGIFTTSYLRQYALAIGYDEAHLLEYYDRKVNGIAVREKPPQEPRGLLDRWLGPAQAQH